MEEWAFFLGSIDWVGLRLSFSRSIRMVPYKKKRKLTSTERVPTDVGA
jgi:hypothetical protein